jgi:hypothetical protein
MRRLVGLVVAALWLGTVAPATFAYPEWVEEVWRSPYGETRVFGGRPVIVPSPFDRSFWLIGGANVEHYAADGTMITRSQSLYTPWALAADPADGSCWVLQASKDELLHFDANGRLLSATPGPSFDAALLPSPADGSLWVSDTDQVMHIGTSGAVVWTLSMRAQVLAADPEDGSVWMAEGSDLVRRASDGDELWRIGDFGAGASLGEDARNRSVWAGNDAGRLTHISAAGEVLSEHANARRALRIAVLPGDGSLWVQYSSNPDNPGSTDPADRGYAARLDASGAELFRKEESSLWFANLHDGSAWIRSPSGTVLYSADGQALSSMHGDVCIAFDPVDSSYWVTEDQYQEPVFAHRAVDGTVLWSQWRECLGWRFWVDPSDGSCWTLDSPNQWAGHLDHWSPEGVSLGSRSIPHSAAGDSVILPLAFDTNGHTWWGQDGGALLHIDEDGTILWRQDSVIQQSLRGFEISPEDGSVWLASGPPPPLGHVGTPLTAHLVHLAADGTLLSATDYAVYFWDLSLGADGSLWVAAQDETAGKLVKLSSAGEVIAELPLPAGLVQAFSLQMRASDGSLYGTARSVEQPEVYPDTVFQMTADGALLWQISGYSGMGFVPQDGSVWVAAPGHSPIITVPEAPSFRVGSAVAHLDADGQCLWRGETFSGPGYLTINSYDGSPWLYDFDNCQLVHLQVAPLPFSDVPADYWAFDAIVACVDAGIVQGYGDNTYLPELPVTRSQMAAYISRGLAGSDGAVTVPTGVIEPSFTDVGEDHWAYRYIEYCVGANIVEGYPDGGYRPDEVVNRGQMAVYIARTLVTPSGDADVPHFDEPVVLTSIIVPGFSDVTPDNEWAWCYDHVMYCVAQGVVQGFPVPPGSSDLPRYEPANPVTRDQMAVFVARTFGLGQE